MVWAVTGKDSEASNKAIVKRVIVINPE